MRQNRKYKYLILHKVGGDIMRRAFEKRRRSPDNLKPLNQFGHLPRKQKKRLCNEHKADLARRKGIAKLRSDIKMVRYYLRVETNIRRLRRPA
jgi:hypothetical protein